MKKVSQSIHCVLIGGPGRSMLKSPLAEASGLIMKFFMGYTFVLLPIIGSFVI